MSIVLTLKTEEKEKENSRMSNKLAKKFNEVIFKFQN